MSARIIHMQAQAEAELERKRVAQRASNTRWKEIILNDSVYREEVLLHHKAERGQKHKAIENDPHHLDAMSYL